MKNSFKTLLFVGCITSLSLDAQTKSDSEQNVLNSSDSKVKYVKNQGYLSKSSLKDYKTYYGDSLKGFDENAVKIDLLSRNFYGIEFINVMNYKKREFIDAKYKIGAQYAPKSPFTVQGGTNSKPIGGNNTINALPCINEDFESSLPGVYTTSNAITGWIVESGSNNGTNGACPTNTAAPWTTAISEFSIVTTPIIGNTAATPFSIDNVTIPNSPLGGSNVARLNNTSPGVLITRIRTTFPVTAANTLFQFAYAGSWDGSGHACCDQPSFRINMYDCTGAPLGCSSISLTPPGAACASSATGYSITNNISWCNWQLKYIDLTPYIGTCVTLIVTNSDCDGGAHHGSLYFDSKCGGSLLCSSCSPPGGTLTTIAGPVSFCAGAGQAQIAAPTGYATYSWVAPSFATPIAASQASLATITINNPIPSSVYTVYLTSFSGCQFVSTNTIVFTSVNIAGIGSAPSCAMGASGTASVLGNGSGTGYNYTWLNSANSVVSTASVATGLAAGVYTVGISGLGAAGCGSAATTVTVGTAPPGVQNLIKPFCGSGSAYLGTTGGSNFQWYNNTTLIPAPLGTAQSYTVTNPVTGQIVTLRYLSNQGCQDSVKFTLAATSPGLLVANNISWICPGGTNGTALVNLSPALGTPPGLNWVTVVGTGTTPAYNYTTPISGTTTYSLSNLAAGNYSANAFDGSCYYSTNFAVNSFTFSYNVSPTSPTLCPGNSIASAITFTSPPSLTQYSYSWTPTTFLAGNIGNLQQTIITPTANPGATVTTVYTVVVTPSVVNCPVAKTITITAINPATPTINVIPNLCNTFAPYQIVTNPPGGTFSTNIPGPNSPVAALTGIISPSLASTASVNTVFYKTITNTCVATNSATYQVSKFWSAALSSSVPPLCVTNSPFNLMNIVQSTVNGSWSGAQGVVGTTQFNPANLSTNAYQINYTTFSSPNATVCPDISSLTVQVTATITPTITPVPEFCTNASTFNLIVNPPGGNWVPIAGVSNFGAVNPGNINVTNLIATYSINIGPCLNSNSTNLQISQFNPATLSSSVANLCYNSSPVNLMSIVQGSTNGSWSGLNGVVSNSFIPQNLQTNTYVAVYSRVSSPNATLCPDSRTIAISVLNPPTPTITQVGPLCNNALPLQLQVNPSSGSWTGSSYLSNTGVFNPALSAVGNNAVQYVIGTSTCNVQQIKNISIEAFIPASIISPIPNLCNTNPATNLSPITISGSGIWSGPGVVGTSFHPSNTGSGNFVLSYHTESSPSGLCPDNATVAVTVFSLAAPAVTKAGPYCNNSLPVQLQVSPVGGLFGGPNLGIISLAGKFNPASALIGENIVNYSITSGPCVAYAQTTVTVVKFVSANFENIPGPFCKTSQAVNLNSYVQNPGGKWYNALNGVLIGDAMFDPSKAIIGGGTVLTYVTNSIPFTTLCPDSKTLSIEVKDTPKVVAISNAAGNCLPVLVSFNLQNTNEGDGVWIFGDGSEPVKGLSAEHIYTSPGTYTAQYNYTDGIGCKAAPSFPQSVIVRENPKANFSLPEEVYISDPQVQITNLTTVLNNNIYNWKISNMANMTDVNPVVSFPKIGRYTITLTATSAYNCKDELTKSIEVKNNYSVFIPNSFSPNFDGLNDVFLPVFSKEGIDTKYFEMEIFDRWGHSIFRTKDITKGWDGLNKGESLKEEIYVYKIKYKDLDGNLYDKMGHITLVK